MVQQDRPLRVALAEIAACVRPSAMGEFDEREEAFEKRFLDQVDPDRALPEAERLRRAAAARKLYFADLAFRSARARRKA